MRPEDIDAIIGQAEEHQTNWGRPRYSEDEMREAIRIAYVSGLERAARVADIEAARSGRQLLALDGVAGVRLPVFFTRGRRKAALDIAREIRDRGRDE